MNFLLAALFVFYGIVVYFFTAKKYYNIGYEDALQDVEKLSLAIKKEIEKRQKDEE